MSRLQLRGVIVPSEYDADWAQSYIENGIITPESTFRRALAQAPASEPLDVYVNSPGGSVFAANEMVNAIREWKIANKQPVSVTVGAMAASAAAVFSITAADSVRAHANAKMMFHGAWTLTLGGKDAHADQADLLEKINGDAKTRLVTRYNLAPETVNEWFAEGREGWLTADDMKAAGIASDIIGDEDCDIEYPDDAITDIEGRGLGIAALLKTNTTEDAADGRDNSEPAPDAPAPVVAEPDPAQSAEQPPVAPEQPADKTDKENAAYAAGVEAGRVVGVGECEPIIADYKAKLATAESESRKFQGMFDRAVADAAKADKVHGETMKHVTEQLKEANARCAKFLAGSLTFSAEPQGWPEALALCAGNYVDAAKRYPELRDKYNRENSQKR